ncbi:lipase member M-like [Rhipicephalus sanguineus]|uniref:lipase member M-like n=1 Tax=Rhipicephalus sanguineus TaxID=34632 RepID=UPI0020C57CEF|nr:lipase member M-like [Rhipicephalus sanguineus]
MLWILYCVLWFACPTQRSFIVSQWQPDAFRSPAELVRSKGYAAEEHVTTTEDGYVLSLQHVLSGGGRLPGALPGPPVLLVHGLLSSAVEWVINYPQASHRFLLADAGYDVWLGNYRGTPYSRGHREYSDSDSRYWDFRLDEIGLLDLPALVDYVLASTGWPQLFLVGFSQGNTAAWAMLADKPQYNNKILLVVALAPVANMTFIRSPVRVLVPISPLLTVHRLTKERSTAISRRTRGLLSPAHPLKKTQSAVCSPLTSKSLSKAVPIPSSGAKSSHDHGVYAATHSGRDYIRSGRTKHSASVDHTLMPGDTQKLKKRLRQSSAEGPVTPFARERTQDRQEYRVVGSDV